jgi:CBS domain-containing protein
MKAKEIMTEKVITIDKEAPVDKIIKLLLKHRISGAPVVDENNKIVGVVSEEDLLYKEKLPLSVTWLYLYGDYVDPDELATECRKAHATTAAEIMSMTPVLVSEDTDLPKIAFLMLEKGIRRVFVMKKGEITGVVSKADLLKAMGGGEIPARAKAGGDTKCDLSTKKVMARDVMTSEVITIGRTTTIRDVARILLSNRITGVPVVDERNNVIGIVSESDLLYGEESIAPVSAYSSSWKDCVERFWRTSTIQAEKVMSGKVIAVKEDTPVEEIATLMLENKIKRVPVLKEKKLVGIVSRADVLKALLIEPKPRCKVRTY